MSDGVNKKTGAKAISKGEDLQKQNTSLMVFKGFVALLAGIVLLFWPQAGIAITAIALGAFLVADGLERLISFFQSKSSEGSRFGILRLLGALLQLILGLVVIFNPVTAGSIWMTLVFIIAGAHFIVGSVYALCAGPNKDDVPTAGTAGVMLLLGILMILLPIMSATVLLRIIGGVLILVAIGVITTGLRKK